jgi:hypothetical protein
MDNKMKNRDTSISDYIKYVSIKDSIAEIFRTYIEGYGLGEKINNEEIELMTDRFEKEYQKYVMDTFLELDIQTKEINGTTFIVVDELMTKVAGVIASKLAAELLMIELINRFVHK